MDWTKRLILFHGRRHPAQRGPPEVEWFLTPLAGKQNAAASTQNQASAILFLYKEVLGQELGELDK